MWQPFHSADIKLQWAKQYIDHLDVQSVAYLRKRFELRVGRDSFGQTVMRVKYHGELPPHFGLMVGDIVTNLRDVLDHIIWDIVAPKLGPQDKPGRVCFPFLDTGLGEGKRLISAIEKALIHLAGPDAVRIVHDARPYPGEYGGDAELYGLHRLASLVKHRNIAFVSDYAHIHGVKAKERSHRPYIPLNNLRMGHGAKLESDIQIHGLGLKVNERNMIDNDQFDMTFHIVFAQGQPFAGLPVLPTMIALVKKVEGLLADFDKAYPFHPRTMT
jgi:hypothetical protein